jgi:hypothetical protein
LTALVTEHFVLQTARSTPTTSRRLTSAASLVAILNSVVFGTGLTAAASALAGGFRGWDVMVGLAGAALACWLALRFEAKVLNTSAA